LRLRWRRRRRRIGGRRVVDKVRAEVPFESEIGGIEEEAGVAEAGAAEGEFVEGERRVVGGGEEVGGDGAGAFGLPTEIGYEGREFGADTGQASPVARIVFEIVEDVQNDVVG